MDAPDYPIRHFARMADFAAALKPLPAQVLEHSYSYESFGSWWATIRYRGMFFRVVFDGKEGRLAVQRSVSREAPHVWGSAVWEHAIRADTDWELRDFTRGATS
jgi:hypothetical protein